MSGEHLVVSKLEGAEEWAGDTSPDELGFLKTGVSRDKGQRPDSWPAALHFVPALWV